MGYMPKTILEEAVEQMVILKRITSPTGSISDRAKSRLENCSKEVYERLKEKQYFSEDSKVYANLDWRDGKGRARSMALGIQEFTKLYPEYGKKLQEIIEEKHRGIRRTYIEFGLNSENDLPQELYIRFIMSLGEEFTRDRSEKLYYTISEFCDVIGRVKEKGKYDILLPE